MQTLRVALSHALGASAASQAKTAVCCSFGVRELFARLKPGLQDRLHRGSAILTFLLPRLNCRGTLPAVAVLPTSRHLAEKHVGPAQTARAAKEPPSEPP
eukprot:15253008-Alexandrium_andersonii.AAC.1